MERSVKDRQMHGLNSKINPKRKNNLAECKTRGENCGMQGTDRTR